MKKLIYITFLLVSITLSSCTDVLDLEPQDRITGIWDNEALVEAYVTGMYPSLEHGFAFDMWGCLTDEMHAVHDAGTWNVQKGELTADNVTGSMSGASPTFNKWGNAYKQIRIINEFLKLIGESSIDDALKTRLTGEVKFIRAYLYSELLWRYGDIPIITDVFEIGDDYSNVSRESYDKAVDFIISELDEAISLLPTQSETKKGRASQHAAMALKSRVLLYAASPLNNPNNDLNKWQAAADAAEALLDKGYTLYGDYQNLFLEETNEIIFARYFTKTLNHNINGWSGLNSLSCGGGNAPSENIVMDYEMINGELPYNYDDIENKWVVNPASGFDPSNPYINRDPRFHASILYDGCVFQGHVVEKFEGGVDSPQSDILGWNATMTGYCLNKFINPKKSVNLRTDDLSTNPWMFFRYGEILLNYAEAKFELGDENTAREYINQIRARVNMPPVTSTGEELRDKIRHERRIELAFEGHRFFDVRRWKILEEVSNKNLLGMHIFKNEDGSKTYNIFTVNAIEFHEQHYRLPIPEVEITRSQGALTQNPGY